ncbi:MAG: DUF4202 domain-containing protein [Xanthobacteraceae bacterium]
MVVGEDGNAAEPSPRLIAVLAAIDAANACDPTSIEVDGQRAPAALVDGRRMSAVLARLAPDASEHLQIAVRGHHIARWTSPRQSYPAGRVGYLKWRRDLGAFHARRLAEIMTGAGYSPEDSSRVGTLVRKEGLGSDPETQMFEDVVCLVFLEHGLHDFMAKTDEDKLARILAKTWRKMSETGHQHALALGIPPAVHALLDRGLAALARPGSAA